MHGLTLPRPIFVIYPGADLGLFKKRGGGGSILGLQAKKGGKRGSNFGPNVNKPTSWAKKGGPDPLGRP